MILGLTRIGLLGIMFVSRLLKQILVNRDLGVGRSFGTQVNTEP